MKFIYILFCTLLIFTNANATLPEGLKAVQYSIGKSSAEKLWKKDNTSPIYYSNNGKTSFTFHDLNFQLGLSNSIHIETGLTYGKSEMKKGSEGGSVKGDNQSGISGIRIGISKGIWSDKYYVLEGSFSIKHPINRGISFNYGDSPDTFIALNDGAIHYSFGLSNSLIFNKYLSTVLDIEYIKRDGDPKDQYTLSLFVPVNICNKIQVGAGINIKETMGGPDIGTSEFSAEVAKRSNGNSKIKAFSIVNEEVLGISLFSSYVINDNWSVNGHWNKNLDGRNTDASTSIGLGATYLIY